jgi:hypothetical protein
VSGSRRKTKSVLKGRWNPSSFQDESILRPRYQPLRSWLISIPSLRDSAAPRTFARSCLQIHHRRITVEREGPGALKSKTQLVLVCPDLFDALGVVAGKTPPIFGATSFVQGNPAAKVARWK